MNLTTKDRENLREIEMELNSVICPKSFYELNNFPFKDIEDLRESKNKDLITLGITTHNFNLIYDYGKPSDINTHLIYLFLSIGLLFYVIGYAFYIGDNLYFLGIFSWAVGFGLTSPSCQSKSLIGVFLILFIVSFFLFEIKYSWLLGVVIFTNLFTQTNRNITINSVVNNAIESEQLFTYLFKTKMLLSIKDNSNEVFLNPNDY